MAGAHSRLLPARALVLPLTALAAAVLGNVLLRGQDGGVAHLPWLLAMVPAFLLAYHRGWWGVTVAIAMGMGALALSQSVLLLAGADIVLDLMLGGIVAAFIGAALGAGWLREALKHRWLLSERHSRELYILLDAGGTVRWAAPSVERILGRFPPEIEGRPIADLAFPEDAQRLGDALADVLSDPSQTEVVECAFWRSGGEARVMEVVLRNHLGDPMIEGVILNGLDVTDQRTVQAELRRTLEWLRALVNASSDAIFLTDEESRILVANSAASDLTGYTQTELAGLVGMEVLELDGDLPWPIHAERKDSSEGARHMAARGALLRKDGTRQEAGVEIRSIDMGGNSYFHATARPSAAPRSMASTSS